MAPALQWQCLQRDSLANADPAPGKTLCRVPEWACHPNVSAARPISIDAIVASV